MVATGLNAHEEAGDMERLAPCGAHIHFRLPVEPESVTAAHHSVFGIASSLDPAVFYDVRLLISELVTNAIRHAGLGPDDWIDLHVDLEGGQIRVEVRDSGCGFDPGAIPATRPSAEDADEPPDESPDGLPAGLGWGLVVLRKIASRWGVERGSQTCVWFEMDLRPPPRAGRPSRGAGRPVRFAPRGHG